MPQPHQGTPRTIRAKRVVLEEDGAAAATSDFFQTCQLGALVASATTRSAAAGQRRPQARRCPRARRASPSLPTRYVSFAPYAQRSRSLQVRSARRLFPPPSPFAPSTGFARCVAANPELWEQLELLCPEALPLAAEILDHKTIIRCVARDSKREFYTVSASAKQLYCCIPGWCSCNSYAFEVLSSRKLVCKHELAVLVASALDDRVHTNVLDDEKWVAAAGRRGGLALSAP